MKVGINLLLWTATPNFSEHGQLLEKIKEWGFDAFEIGRAECVRSGKSIRKLLFFSTNGKRGLISV